MPVSPRSVAVLCVGRRSVYRSIPGLELFDQDRDALTFQGGKMVIAHPPCARWSRMKGLSNYSLEAWLAPFCFEMVRRWGGVLEHPAHSEFWRYIGITPLVVDLHWFGFPARKPTGLFFHGWQPGRLPYSLDCPQVDASQARSGRRALSGWRRAETPLRFAEWLLDSTPT